MVETRRRRILSQSEDEVSVASSTRRTRSSSIASNNEPTSAASSSTRRSTRTTRSSKGEKSAAREELEAIPEAVAPVDGEGGRVGDAAVGTVAPAKSAKQRRKKDAAREKAVQPKDNEKDTLEGVAADGDVNNAAIATPSSKEQGKEEEEGTTPASGKSTKTEASTSTKKKGKKMKKRRKESIDSEVSSHSAKTEETPKTGKNSTTKKQRESDKTPSPAASASTKSSRKKKSRKGINDAEGTSDADTTITSNKTRDAPKQGKSDHGTPKVNPTPNKSHKKKKARNKSKGIHKKQQSHKHGRPAVSPSPKTKVSPPKPVIDVKVHRLRFLKLHPRAILAMSATPLDSAGSSKRPRHPVRLAISREGGSVELVSPQDRWAAVGDVPGVRGRDVDALVWVCGKQGKGDKESGSQGVASNTEQSHHVRLVDEQRHLFGCSRDGTIFELDFATKRQRGVIGSGGGGVFCLTSMCSRGNCCGSQAKDSDGSCGGYFAAGCEDGTIKIYTAFGRNRGMPELVATLPSAGNAILSLAWIPGQSGNDDGGMGGSVIYAGVADGTIRRFDCSTSTVAGPISTGSVLAPSRGSVSLSYRWKSSLRMTVENQGLRVSTKVWAVQALSDGTVVSGDSLGHVQIWDGRSGTLSQTFDHNESGADVLCLAVSEDENKIFASGVDSSVRCYQRQCLPTPESTNSVLYDSTPMRKWISSNSHRKHSHDVKALAVCHKQTTNSTRPIELLVSGGVDTRICTYVTKDYQTSRPKIWYNRPILSPISLSRKQRLLAATRDDRIDLYRLSNPTMADPDETKCLVKTISIQSPFNLCCSVISDDGKFLAASDAVSLYLFSIEVEDKDGMYDIHPTKLILSSECKHPATALRFDGRGRLICATNNGPLNILKISPVTETDSADGSLYTISLEHVFNEHKMDWSTSSHHVPVVCLDVSSDGKWLAAGRFSTGKGSVHIFALPTSNEDGPYKHWWSLPTMDAPTTCLKFLGGGGVAHSLAVGCSNNEFYIYNLSKRRLTNWSNDMGLPLLKSLPKELTSRSEPVTRILSNPLKPQRFILGSHGFFCVVDLEKPVPESAGMFPPDHLRARRLQSKEDETMYYPTKKSKSRFNRDTHTNNLTICLRYCEILFQDFIGKNEMVVVEEPATSILEDLPETLNRRVYGM